MSREKRYRLFNEWESKVENELLNLNQEIKKNNDRIETLISLTTSIFTLIQNKTQNLTNDQN
jgi:hypothetical protein